MKKLIVAAALVLSTAAGAYADSSALDVLDAPAVQHKVDYTATASIGSGADFVQNDRLGDGAPAAGLTTGFAKIGTVELGAPLVQNPHLGDGSPR